MSETPKRDFEKEMREVERRHILKSVAEYFANPPDIDTLRTAFGYGTESITDDERYALRLTNQLMLRIGHLRMLYEQAEANSSPEVTEALTTEYERVRSLNDEVQGLLLTYSSGEELEESVVSEENTNHEVEDPQEKWGKRIQVHEDEDVMRRPVDTGLMSPDRHSPRMLSVAEDADWKGGYLEGKEDDERIRGAEFIRANAKMADERPGRGREEVEDSITETVEEERSENSAGVSLGDDMSMERPQIPESEGRDTSLESSEGKITSEAIDTSELLSTSRQAYELLRSKLANDELLNRSEHEQIIRLEKKLEDIDLGKLEQDASLREHLRNDTENRLLTLYQGELALLRSAREEFEKHFGTEMTEMRDQMTDLDGNQKTEAQEKGKRTGWWNKQPITSNAEAEAPEVAVDGVENESQEGNGTAPDEPKYESGQVVLEEVQDSGRISFPNGRREEDIEGAEVVEDGVREAERQVWLTERGRVGEEGEKYDRIIEEWKEVRTEADAVSKQYQDALSAYYAQYYNPQGNVVSRNAKKWWVSGKESFGFKPSLTPELRVLRERDEYLQGQYAALGGRLVEQRRHAMENAEVVEDERQQKTEAVIGRYQRMLERKLALKPMQERIEVQKKALEGMPQNKTFNAMREVMRKNKYALLTGRVVLYGGIGAATGGVLAGALAAGRVGAGFVSGVGGGFLGRGLTQGYVNRADAVSERLLSKKMNSLTAQELRQRRAELIEAYTIKDDRLRHQRYAAIAGAIIGGGAASAAFGDELGEKFEDGRQWYLAKTSEPPDVPEEVTKAPEAPSPVSVTENLGQTSESLSLDTDVAQPEILDGKLSTDELLEKPPLPPEVAELGSNEGIVIEENTGEVQTETSALLPEVETITTTVLPEQATEIPPEVNGQNILELEKKLGLMPQDATVEDMLRTPLDYSSAERLSEQEHLFELGHQYGQSTVSEQVYEAWKDGAFDHLKWVPGPDEMSKEEFLDTMNQFIDMNGPDHMSAEEIRSMGIGSGDFHAMQHGEHYDAVPLLDKMFPAHEVNAADLGHVGVEHTDHAHGVVGEDAPHVETVPEPPVTRRIAVTSFRPPEEITTTVLPPPGTTETIPVTVPAESVLDIPSNTVVTTELLNSPLFNEALDKAMAKVGTSLHVDPARVMAEIVEKVNAESVTGSDSTISDVESIIYSVFAREHTLDHLEPSTGEYLVQQNFDKLTREVTMNDWSVNRDLYRDVLVGLTADAGFNMEHFSSVMKALETFVQPQLSFSENIEMLFKTGQFHFNGDHTAILDKQGSVLADLAFKPREN